MGPPFTVADAVGLVRKSQLLDTDACRRVADRAATGDLRGLTPAALFDRLALDGLITPFQARQLAAGRWRGLVLRNYKLLARLGAGGTGQVYLAEHLALGRRVALKVLAMELADNPAARARLVREARAAAVLDHPNIVRVYDIDADATPPYLVMEYVDGVSLQAAVAVAGTFRAEAAALVARQVATGLQHAWENGLVHRDVKPANLLLDRRGTAYVLDLGIVRMHSDDEQTAAADGNQILGTIDYLAPEQARDSSTVDGRADVYGLGATLYFLLAGHPPFAIGSPSERLLRKQTDDPPPIHLLRPDVPPGLSAVVAAMLARRPENRIPSAAAVASALAPFARPAADFPEDIFAAVSRYRGRQRDAAEPSGSVDCTRTTVAHTRFPSPPAGTVVAPVSDIDHPPSTKRLSAPLPVPKAATASHADTPTPLRANHALPKRARTRHRPKRRPDPRRTGNAALFAALAAALLAALLLVTVLIVFY